MGNKSTRAATSFEWPERAACATTPVSPSTLSERDAWDLAILWHPQLCRFVRLIRDQEHAPEMAAATAFHKASVMDVIVERLEWIEFDFLRAQPQKHKELVRVARAATVVWFALSCCPGFGGDENPMFWKRVFSAMMRTAPMDALTHYGGVTDREMFFDHPDRPFPRVRFHGFSTSLPLDLFWEPSNQRVHQPQEEALQEILLMLQSFVIPSRWKRSIPLSIRVEAEGIDPIQLAQQCLNESQEKQHDLPQFQLVETLYRRYNTKHDLVRDVRMHLCISINNTGWESNRIEPAMESLLAQQRHPVDPPQQVAIHTLDLQWKPHVNENDQDTTMVAAWCSALPHTKLVRSVRAVDCYSIHRYDDKTAAWLGYALFHPDIATYGTSIESLTLGIDINHPHSVDFLQQMALGNNLLVGLGISTTESTAYYQARVQLGATVFFKAEKEANPLYMFPLECWITLCKLSEDEPFLEDWACIVLPGHGIGWILAEKILEIKSCSTAPSCVRRLRLILLDETTYGLVNRVEDNNVSGEMKAVLLNVLSVLGNRLSYLHIDSSGMFDTTTVQSILRLCPNLSSLRIPHDGSCWAESEMVETPKCPRLEELELTISRSLHQLHAPQLDKLRVFRVVCGHHNKLGLHRSIVQGILMRYPQLQYLHWHVSYLAPSGNSRFQRTFDESYAYTRKQLDPLATGAYDTVLKVVPVQARVAFLSVVDQSWKIPPDVIKLIFEFSSSFIPRLLHVCDAG